MSNASSKDVTTATKDTKALPTWPWHPIQALLLTFMIFLVSQFVAGVLAVAGTTLLKLDDTVAQFAVIAAAEVSVVLVVRWLLRHHRISFRQLGFGRARWSDAGVAVAALIIYFVVLRLAISALQSLVPGIDADQKQAIGFDHASGLGQLSLVFVALVVCAPVAEEVLFRGFLFGSLRRRGSFVMAAVVTSVLFGLAHLGGGDRGFAAPLWTAGLDTLILSLTLCYLREKTGRLWASILVHAMKNGLAFVLLFIVHI